MKRARNAAMIATTIWMSTLFQSCSVFDSLLSNCYGNNSISKSEYDKLNDFEQLLYDKNSCGRYEPASDLFAPFLRGS